MDLNAIFDIILKVVAILAAASVTYVLPTVASKLKETIGVERTEQLAATIKTFVISAESTLKLETGEEKKAYVEKQLEDVGVEVTELVKAMIEEAVFNEINFGVKEKVIDNTPAVEEAE